MISRHRDEMHDAGLHFHIDASLQTKDETGKCEYGIRKKPLWWEVVAANLHLQ